MGQTCIKTAMRRASQDPNSASCDDGDFVYKTPWPYSESTFELKGGKESLLIKTRLRISYSKCAIQPKMEHFWPEATANDKPRQQNHNHHHKRRHHQHHNRCNHHHHHHHQKYTKIKEDSGFIDLESESDQATSFDNDKSFRRMCCKSSDHRSVQNTINWLSSVQPAKQHHQSHHHHHHHHHIDNDQYNDIGYQHHNNNGYRYHTKHQTTNNQPSIYLSGHHSKSTLLNQYNQRGWREPGKRLVTIISSSSSSSSPPSPSRDIRYEKVKMKQLVGKYVIGDSQHDSSGRIFDVKGHLIRQDINHSRLELQKFVMDSFLSNNVKFTNSAQFKLPS